MSALARLVAISQFNITEAPAESTSPDSSAAGLSRMFDALNKQVVLQTGGAINLVANVVSISRTLAAADEDVDLTAAPLARAVSLTTDMTNKKLVAFAFYAPSTNVAAIIIKPHPTTNAYPLFIGSTEQRTIAPGQTQPSFPTSDSDAIPTLTVISTRKVIRISGTVGDVLSGLLLFA
jgi:hypothetical protein